MIEYLGSLSLRRLRAFLLLCSAAVLPLVPVAAFGADAPAAAAPVAPEKVHLVDISEYQVEGNTLLDTVDVQEAVYPFVGPQRPVTDAEKARAALEKAYFDKGYQAVIVQLPPQNVKNGVVHIKVVEAKIGKVSISGGKYTTDKEVLSNVPSLEEGKVPNFQSLNKDLVAFNTRSADLQVTPQLKPGALPDTIDVDLAVTDERPLHGSLELNNNYSQSTHPLRLQANVSYDDLWHMGHSISAYYDVAPEAQSDAAVYLLTYSAPLPGSDIRLSVTGLKSDSNVTTIGSTGVIGKGHSITLNANAPLPMLGNYSQSLQAGFAYKDFLDQITVTGQSDNAPITYYPLSLTYNGSYRGDADLISLSSALNFSFRGLGSPREAYDAKRYRALSNFLYLRSSVSWQRDLPFGSQLYLEADGQISTGPLISNEQFAAGGEGSVRGYLQAEALGDNGVHETIELRSPSLAPYVDKASAVLDEFRFIAFADMARAWLVDPLPEQQSDYRLFGAGLGIRARLKWVSLEGDWARPFISNSVSTANENRFYFRVYTQF